MLLLVERRFGGSRAQPLVDRVYDALALRRRRRHVELRRPRTARGALRHRRPRVPQQRRQMQPERGELQPHLPRARLD